MPRRHGTHPPTQEDLVEALIADAITDARVLEAFRAVPRAGFVPSELADRAYVDMPLPIRHDQVTTQPSLVAKMVEALALQGPEKVLEIGTGYGFQTALLAYLATFVWSIERWRDIAETARGNLARQGIVNAEVIVGDGTEGLPERAPFDAVLVSAAFPTVAEPIAEQLAAGGRLVQPIGTGGAEDVVFFVKEGDGLVPRATVTGARFVRLYGRHGFPA
jgi:protein-L-isoaspartate(D-aspartate) O-methyltransferase